MTIAETNSEPTPPAWLPAAQDEWRLHPSGSFDLERAAQQTLAFGGATIGVLTAGAINGWKYVVPSTLIFLVVIPPVAAAVGAQWTGQMLSVQRERRYVRDLEHSIRSAYGSRGWIPEAFYIWEELDVESWGKKMRPDRRWLAAGLNWVFMLFAAWSLAMASYRARQGQWHSTVVAVVAACEL